MGIITNTHRDPLGLPSGQVLNPNTPTPVHNWAEIRKNAVVAAWLRAGLLTEQDAPPSAQSSQFVQPDKTELMAKLDALGVHYDRRSGVAKLQALLADAEAAAAEAALAALIEADAIEASGKTADEFAALPEEERTALLEAAAAKLQGEQA